MFKCISIEEAKQLMDKEQVVVVDVRDLQSFEERHVENAIYLNDANIEEFIKTCDKSKPTICFCYHGHSSQQAADYLSEQGISDVYSVDGGFESWRQVYPTG